MQTHFGCGGIFSDSIIDSDSEISLTIGQYLMKLRRKKTVPLWTTLYSNKLARVSRKDEQSNGQSLLYDFSVYAQNGIYKLDIIILRALTFMKCAFVN